MGLQQDIDRITDILRRDDGISGAMHYTEQISWILFLKFLDDLEREKENEAILTGTPWKPILPFEYRWSTWACPKTPEGELNLNQATTGDDLSDFVNDKLFPYLKAFSETEDINSFQYKIGAIFQFLENRIVSGHHPARSAEHCGQTLFSVGKLNCLNCRSFTNTFCRTWATPEVMPASSTHPVHW